MMSIHVEGLDHPDDPDVAIQLTDGDLHQCINLDAEDAETLLTLLRGVVDD